MTKQYKSEAVGEMSSEPCGRSTKCVSSRSRRFGITKTLARHVRALPQHDHGVGKPIGVWREVAARGTLLKLLALVVKNDLSAVTRWGTSSPFRSARIAKLPGV